MREAIAGLTVRGRAFLAAGVTAVVCAVLLGQPALARIGVLLGLVPLVSAYLLGRRRYDLTLTRTVTPSVVPAGQPATVELTVGNAGGRPAGALLLEDHLPHVLGTRPRFVLDGVEQGWSRRVTYQVRSDVRGQFAIGPMTVRVRDPFGMVELGRAFRTTAPLTVTPRVAALPAIPLEGAWTGSGDNRPRAFATGSAEDVTVREYRLGDDLRRVHWRSSAKVGQLMVRREEQPWQSRATVFLDHRRQSHHGEGIASSFETAVHVAASVAVHLAERGYAVRLVTADGEDPSSQGWHHAAAQTTRGSLLKALAVVTPSRRASIDTRWLGEHLPGTLTVAVLGGVGRHDRSVLRRMRHQASSALALVVDVSAWTPRRGDGTEVVPGLVRDGWRAVEVHPGSRLDAAWQQLGPVRTTRVRR